MLGNFKTKFITLLRFLNVTSLFIYLNRGVNTLHGIPGIVSGLVGAVVSAMAENVSRFQLNFLTTNLIVLSTPGTQ